MAAIFYLTMALLTYHVANSYILLTANLEDFHSIAKQIAASPVGSQINQIVRRASSLFNQQLNSPQENEPQKRSDSQIDDRDSFEIWKPDGSEKVKDPMSDADSLSEKDEDYLKERDAMAERRNNLSGDDNIITQAKNASFYLQSIQKILETV